MSSNNIKPPGWIQRLVERYCEPYLFEGITGDLEELFTENVELKGPVKAKLLYMLQAIGFFRMRFKKQSKTTSNMKAIWTNYLLTTLRSIKKQKSFFAINLVGLILAIACSLFALIYIHDEYQYDKQHADGNHTYRLYKRYINIPEGVDHLTYETSGMMGPTMAEEYPEVDDFMRVCPWWHKVVLTYNETNITSEKIYFADSTFFDFFGFDLIAGDPKTILAAPSSIAVSETLAKKLFGDKNPIGQSLIGFNNLTYHVTGIFKDPPRHSSLQFEAVISWTTTVPNVGPLSMNWMNNWLAQGIFTFVKLNPQVDHGVVETKLPEMMNRHFEERADQYFLKLIPLEKMYLYGDNIQRARGMKTGSITFIYMLGFSAFLIFLIASVNYINISLSRASQTITEVGIRKVMGSTPRQLMGRFVLETFVCTLVASIIALILLAWLLPQLNMLSGKDLPLETFFRPFAITALITFTLGISGLVGIYPARMLSSPSVSQILKTSSGVVSTTGWFRRILLSLQFAISIFLIICTILIIRQTHYMENKPLGFDGEQVIIMDVDNEIGENSEVFKASLKDHPNILSVSTARSTVGDGSYSTTVIPEGYTDELNTRIFGVDQAFFETFGIKTLAGRTFLPESYADSTNIIVNQTLVDFMGWDDPIGKHIRFNENGNPIRIIGVVNDFHIHSIATSTIEPMILYLDLNNQWFTSIRIGNGDVKETIDFINEQWDKLATRTPFDFFFADDWFNQQYKKERKLLKISTIYAMISILLCGLGLYGLTALLLHQRTREISIRKVLGAPLSSIVTMMNRQFLGIILISFIVSAPIAFWVVNDWLDQFAYKTSIDPYPFIVAGSLTFLVTILIVSGLSIKSANMNPSETLSNE